ncbi:MAG: pilin [Lachnospiraceae bacterium]|nr:pilin [Lachnospiraceae bacterium]
MSFQIVAQASDGSVDLSGVTNPIIGLIKSILGPLIALVGAVGTIYCVLLGVKFAKAEEPQEREKAKAHLKNAIIGFLLIFILIVALNQALPILETWMTKNM